MYSLIFERTILPSKAVRVMASAAIDDGPAKLIGSLSFPSTTMWGKFIGAIQRGALDIPDLSIQVVPGKSVEEVKSGNPSRVAS